MKITGNEKFIKDGLIVINKELKVKKEYIVVYDKNNKAFKLKGMNK